jgi:hypothetical protein
MNKGPKTPAKGTTRFRVSQSWDHFAENHGRKFRSASVHATAAENSLGCLLSHNWILWGCARPYIPCYHRCRSATGTLRSAKRTSDTNLPEVRRPSAYAHRKLFLLWNSRRTGSLLATHRYECVFIQIDRRNSLAERGHPPPGGLPSAQAAVAARGGPAGASLPAAEGKPGTCARTPAPPGQSESVSQKDGAP